MIKNILILFVILLVGAKFAYAHGEDKPGPHGGIIRMPSGFHSEVVPMDARSFKVYLLDFDFKDPISRNSKVDGIVVTETKKFPVQCQSKSEYFECNIQGSDTSLKGKLKLNTIRDGMSGAEMSYDLPLRLHAGNDEHSPSHKKGGEK